MAFVQNFPFFCIIMTLFSGPLSSILGGKAARRLNLAVITLVGAMNTAVFAFVLKTARITSIRWGIFRLRGATRYGSVYSKRSWQSFSV